MARLHEYQGKELLRSTGIETPRGKVVASPDAAKSAVQELGGKAVLKVQAWITGRKAKGGIITIQTPEEAEAAAAKLFSMKFGNFPVSELLIEELLEIENEMFVSITIDDAAQQPVLLLDCAGGTGIEDRASAVTTLPLPVTNGLDVNAVKSVVHEWPVKSKLKDRVFENILKIVGLARMCDARSFEVNPLVSTKDSRVIAADCRIAIDDYAVFRHPELGIEIARELDHPPTQLERIAYKIEEADHRGTFYFAQLPIDENDVGKGVIGFHGAGGGGSMMSMDAITSEGFTIANFCDTSGNPSAAKVYRAARIILSLPGLVGYFGSGSGVASQEQFHSAYGLAKAFMELKLDVPAVIRLGGNSEDRAVDILARTAKLLNAKIEGYRKDDTPALCAQRFTQLVHSNKNVKWTPRPRTVSDFVCSATSIPINGGTLWIDSDTCHGETTDFVVSHSSGLLRNENSKPVLAVSSEEIASKDSELIALEMECCLAHKPVIFVDLPIPNLDSSTP